MKKGIKAGDEIMVDRLTLEQTKTCLIGWREFEDTEALEVLVTYNSGLVDYAANLYRGKGLTFEELQAAGNEGLIRGINNFDYQNRKIEGFSSYLYICIRNIMIAELKSHNKHNHVLSLNDSLYESIDDGSKLTIEDIVGTNLDELINEVITKIKSEEIREALLVLKPRHRLVILLRYGLINGDMMKKTDIAQILGVTGERVRQIEKDALSKLYRSYGKALKGFEDD